MNAVIFALALANLVLPTLARLIVSLASALADLKTEAMVGFFMISPIKTWFVPFTPCDRVRVLYTRLGLVGAHTRAHTRNLTRPQTNNWYQ
jgi:hypothetical protein